MTANQSFHFDRDGRTRGTPFPLLSASVVSWLFNIGAYHRVPVIGNELFGGIDLIDGGEDSLRRRFGWVRKLGSKLCRDNVAFNQVGVASRMAVALQPDQLAFI